MRLSLAAQPRADTRSAIGLLRLLLATSLILPALLFMTASWLNYRTVFADAERDLLRTSEVAREHAAKLFDSQTQVADRITDLVRGMDAAAIRKNEKPLHEAFANIVARLPQVQSVLLADKDGHPLVSAGTYPVPDVDLRGRDYHAAIVGGYSGTYVSSLQVGDVNRQLFFGLARPWIGADGKLAGVVDVAVSPSFFEDFYHALVTEDGRGIIENVVSMIREDGQFLVRWPPLPSALTPPRSATDTPFFSAIRNNPDHGIYETRAQMQSDTPTRLFAYRKVQGYPVYVVAGRSRGTIIGEWRRTMGSQLLFGIPTTLALFAVTWTALVRTRREEEALARAHEEFERREVAEAALLRAQRLEAVGQMTGGVAHDFNNLLMVVLGGAEMLDRRADNPAMVRKIAGQMTLAARRGGEITQQLLAFSRRRSVSPEIIDVNARLQQFKQLLDSAAGEAVPVELDLGQAIGAVRLDPGHFEAAILNLVGNARDAMPQGGRITILTRNHVVAAGVGGELPPGRYVRVAVTDTGSGMSPATIDRAFEPFFTTKEVGRGTGLGLSQVYGFAKQSGGDIRIQSALGVGSTVEFLLPRTEAAAAAAPSTADAPPLGRAEPGEVVLVVEDEPGVLDMAVESLRDLGYEVLTATAAAAALAVLRQDRRIDLLFSDVVMPGGMSGVELAGAARALRPDLRILLTSGYTGHAPEELPADVPLLIKPYDQAMLATRLRTLLVDQSADR